MISRVLVVRGLWRSLVNPFADERVAKVGTLKLSKKVRKAGIPLKISLLFLPHLDGETFV